MERTEFEHLRDVAGKIIHGDIRLSRRDATRPLLYVDGIVIENTSEVGLRMNISFNPETGSKTINVYVPGMGPICRLDVDGTVHRDTGRSHKHSLQNHRCPDRNLPDDVLTRPDLAG